VVVHSRRSRPTRKEPPQQRHQNHEASSTSARDASPEVGAEARQDGCEAVDVASACAEAAAAAAAVADVDAPRNLRHRLHPPHHPQTCLCANDPGSDHERLQCLFSIHSWRKTVAQTVAVDIEAAAVETVDVVVAAAEPKSRATSGD